MNKLVVIIVLTLATSAMADLSPKEEETWRILRGRKMDGGLLPDEEKLYKSLTKKRGSDSMLAPDEEQEKLIIKKGSYSEEVITLDGKSTSAFAQQKGSFTDPRDGKKYKTVNIGKQTWMAENLNYDAAGSKCYDNKPANCQKYGRLYDWETALKACPSGWHLPDDAEWRTLVDFAGREEIAGKKLKAKSGWDSYKGRSGNGIDAFGFFALPGSYGRNGNFNDVGSIGVWWSTTENNSEFANYRYMDYSNEYADWSSNNKSDLFSVRCLKDEANDVRPNSATGDKEATKVSVNSFTDSRDNKTYKTVKIGSQTWMAENLNYAGKNDDIGLCYDKKPENCKKYGTLYTWYEAVRVCPPSWHLPSQKEWEILFDFVGGYTIAGKKLKAKKGWLEHKCKYEETTGRGNVIVIDKCATDEFNFSALPGGTRNNGDLFSNIGRQGYWWTTRERIVDYAYYLSMAYYSEQASWSNNYKSYVFSVRCLQD